TPTDFVDHDDGSAGCGDEIGVVGGKEDGAVGTSGAQFGDERLAGCFVESVARLIHQDDSRFADPGRAEQELLLRAERHGIEARFEVRSYSEGASETFRGGLEGRAFGGRNEAQEVPAG